MKIIIIEDEVLAAEKLTDFIKKYDSKIEILATLDSVRGCINWFEKNEMPDLIFSDIELLDGNVFSFFQKMSTEKGGKKSSCPIIFATAYDQYAIRAFKVNGIDYLLKPIDPMELEKSIDKFKSFTKSDRTTDLSKLLDLVKEKESNYKTRFMIKVGDRIKSVFVSDIAAILSEDKGTYLIDKNGARHLVDSSLEKIYLTIDPRHFFKINRKYIVSIDSITEIYSWKNSRLKILIKKIQRFQRVYRLPVIMLSPRVVCLLRLHQWSLMKAIRAMA